MSTHNICFPIEIRKKYIHIAVALDKLKQNIIS